MQKSAKEVDWDAAALDEFLGGSTPESFDSFCKSFVRFKPPAADQPKDEEVGIIGQHATQTALTEASSQPTLYRTVAEAGFPRMSQIIRLMSKELDEMEQHEDYAEYQEEERRIIKEVEQRTEINKPSDGDDELGEVLLDEGLHAGQSFDFGAPVAKLDNFVEFDDADLEVEEANFFDPQQAFEFSFSGERRTTESSSLGKPSITIHEIIQQERAEKEEKKKAARKAAETEPIVYLEDEIRKLALSTKESEQKPTQTAHPKDLSESITEPSVKHDIKPNEVQTSLRHPLKMQQEAPSFTGRIQRYESPSDSQEQSDESDSDAPLPCLDLPNSHDLKETSVEMNATEDEAVFNPDHRILTDVDHFVGENTRELEHATENIDVKKPSDILPQIVQEVMRFPVRFSEEETVSHEPVEGFVLDPDFDYDNVVLTPKWDPRFHPELFPEKVFKNAPN